MHLPKFVADDSYTLGGFVYELRRSSPYCNVLPDNLVCTQKLRTPQKPFKIKKRKEKYFNTHGLSLWKIHATSPSQKY